MPYVEWLRVGRCLKCTAIVLGVILFLLVVAEFSVLNFGSKNTLSDVDLHTSHGDVNAALIMKNATTTHSTLPDGTKRTTIVNSGHGIRIPGQAYRGFRARCIAAGEVGRIRPSDFQARLGSRRQHARHRYQ
jgi:hypothetical protein